jgi:hypothetical protein
MFEASENEENKSVLSMKTINSGQDYVCQDDGYLLIRVSGNQEMDVYIYDSTRTHGVRKDIINTAASGIYDSLFIKKGMIINCTYTSTKGAINFWQLVSGT